MTDGIGALQGQMRERGTCAVFFRLNGLLVMCGEKVDSPHDHATDASSHRYTSTACEHDQHGECRRICKFCMNTCLCRCHTEVRR